MPVPTVRLKQLDGFWQTVGVDTYRGVHADNLVLSADMFGSKAASFDLRRDPAVVHQDLSAFTPVKVDVDGVPSWSGRVIETPSRDGAEQAMSVQCEGWQHHLDDDLVDRGWVHRNLTAWKDTRSFLSTPLGYYCAAGTVRQDGAIVLGYPTGATTYVTCAVGVTLDLGPGRAAYRARVTFDSSTFAAGSFTVYLKGHDDMATVITAGENAASGDAATNASLAGTTSLPHRYWSVIVYKVGGGTAVETVDRVLRVTDLVVYTEGNYESGSTSALKASTVIADALTRGAPLINTDQSGVAATSFNLPEYWPDGPRTPREHINAVNAFHGYQFKVDPEKRPIFRALPSRPKFTVGDWSAVELQDSSQNSGQDVYNRVLATATDPAGQPVIVARTAGQSYGYGYQPDASIYWPNPTFETNTASWTVTTGVLTRTTVAGEFDTSPAAGKLMPSGGLGAVSTLTTGTARAGITYEATIRYKGSGTFAVSTTLGGPVGRSRVDTAVNSSAFQTVQVYYTATSADAGNALQLTVSFGSASTLYLDSVQLKTTSTTLIDRRGFKRTKQVQIGATMPSDGVAAAAIADVWLSSHYQTPFRGTLTITGPNALRDRTSGTPIPPAALLRETGELIHFADRIDPDTGGVGRDGRIVSVTYRPDLDQAVIELDNSRADFDQLMSRLAVIQGAQ